MIETRPVSEFIAEREPIQKELIVAGDKGPCIGVNMALDTTTKVLDLVKGREDIFANHDPVHNDPILEEYKKRGLKIEPDVREVPKDSIYIFSAHGVRPSIIKEAKARNLFPVLVECVYVTTDRREVGKAIENGEYVVFFGSKVDNRTTGELVWHPEPIATLYDYDPESYSLININPDDKLSKGDDDPDQIPTDKPIKVFTQTTLSTIQVDERRKMLEEKLGMKLNKVWGICYATDNRQIAVRDGIFGDEDKKPDKLVVIGSKTSNNTGELAKIGWEKIGIDNTFQIDTADELSDEWFESATIVGLTSGASVLDRFSTPTIEWFIERGYYLNLLPTTEKASSSLPGPDLTELQAHLQQKYS